MNELEPYPLVAEEDYAFYHQLHELLLDRLCIREPHLRAYRDELHPVTRNANDRNRSMVVNGPVIDGHLYLNIEMSKAWPVLGMAPGAWFKPRNSLGRGKMAVEDRHQVEADFRPRNIRKLMGR